MVTMPDDLDWIRFAYVRRVLSREWPATARAPAMLHVSADRGVIGSRFARRGFRVEGIRLQDTSPEELIRQLNEQTAAFDIVCCWDGLRYGHHWPTIVSALARALRSGGILFYSVTGRAGSGLLSRLRTWWGKDPNELLSPCELRTTLLRKGLFPQRHLWLGQAVGPARKAWPGRDGITCYVGHALRGRDVAASLGEGAWLFRTTLEQWVYVPAGQDPWNCDGSSTNPRSLGPKGAKRPASRANP
jgi:hypothetical protein